MRDNSHLFYPISNVETVIVDDKFIDDSTFLSVIG